MLFRYVSRLFDGNVMYSIPWFEGSEKNPISWFVNESTWHIAGEYFSALLIKKNSVILLYRPVFSVVENLFVDGHQEYFCRCYTRKFQPVRECLPFLTDTYNAQHERKFVKKLRAD